MSVLDYGCGSGILAIAAARLGATQVVGVDIDPQAVEVTKLSLLLKVLEGETDESLHGQMQLLQERALPDLERNIQCGNSLIGPGSTLGRQLMLGPLDKEVSYRINAFDWNASFPAVMARGGFDAIIGNPPYIRIQALKEWAPLEVDFYKQRYRSASKGNYDIYVVFVERCLELLSPDGRLGFILPHKFFNAQYGEPLRKLLADGKNLRQVVHFGDEQIFPGATNYVCLLFLDKGGAEDCRWYRADNLPAWLADGAATGTSIDSGRFTSSEWNFVVGKGEDLFEKLQRMPMKLGDVASLFVGLQTDADDVFIVEVVSEKNGTLIARSKFTKQEHEFEAGHLKPFLKGSLNVRRYALTDLTKRLIFPYETRDGSSRLITESEYERQFPKTWKYLQTCRKRLIARSGGEFADYWHGYVYKKNHTRFDQSKLVVPAIGTGACFAADFEGKYYFVGSGGGGGGGYGVVLKPEMHFELRYLLGVLNAQVSTYSLKQVSTPFRGGYLALTRQFIEQLPIRPIDFAVAAERAQHDAIVSLVERILAAKQPNPAADTSALEREIDQQVYALYGLTPEEIAIVEGTGQ
ncbi:MAG TPA: hypothetical protein DIT64_22120 [Verrucomicrobiales bacterium]|nr:hypothetical protein [Verrucomicrobiales bacterium]